jgi:hypothetical protein
VLAVVDAQGYHRVGDDEVGAIVRTVVADRTARPDGPVADLPS